MKNVSTKQIAKVMLDHTQPYKWFAILIVFAVIGATALDLISPWFYKLFFDVLTGIGGPSQVALGELTHILLIILALHACSWALYRTAGFTNIYLQTRLMANLEQTSFNYLLGHSFSFFSNSFTGSLVRKVRRLSRAYEDITDNFYWNFLSLLTIIIGTLIALFSRNWMIAMSVLVWMVLMIFVHVGIAMWKLKFDEQKAAQDSKVTGVLADAVTNSTNVKLFVGQSFEKSMFKKATEELMRLRAFTWKIGDTVEALQTLLMIGVEFAVIYIGAKLWAQGLLTVGDFAMFQGYLIMLFSRFWNLGRVVRRTYESMADAAEMVEILETPHEIVDSHIAKPLVIRNGEIEFKDVVFNYRKTRKVLDHFNLKIKPGEKIALVGPSGAGKSTIVKLLFRLHDISQGKILIDGQKISQVTQDSLRKQITMVPQDPVLFHRTLMENIRYGRRNATNKEIIIAAKKARCHEFINEFPDKYQTYVGERGVKLSGGERQRVAIARAILVNPPILVLDEATSSLDSESESLIQSALHELMKKKTVIVIAHRLSTILEMDRIIVVDRGRVVAQGTHNELLKKGGLYKTLWEIQAGGFIK
ncbi:MAG: ABC transporter ATP-binding protein [Patescibacteria group bacterium]